MVAPASLSMKGFRSALCVLRSLDMHDLVAAGVITEAEWAGFQEDPGYAFLRLGDDQKEACWALVQRRMPAPLRETIDQKGTGHDAFC